jgi:hypothetical protein
MKDTKGKEIIIGMSIKSTQQAGGFINPSPSTLGICEADKDGRLVIRFRKSFHEWDSFIILHGKINEIINNK